MFKLLKHLLDFVVAKTDLKTLRICGYPVFCYETLSPLFLNKSPLDKVKLVDIFREPIDNVVGLVDHIFPALIKVKELIFSLDFLSPNVVAILSRFNEPYNFLI